jgi:cyanophycinase-like exopeptidase
MIHKDDMKELAVNIAVPVAQLVLIGGGEFSFGETREIDRYIVSKIASDNRTIAFVPAASGSSEYAQHLGKYFKEIDPSLETTNVPIYRGRDSRRQKNVDLLRFAGLIYIGGGVTNNLLATLRESAAELAMREAAAHGTVIAAIGAAASCFGTHARDMRGVTSALPALGWLDDTVVDAPFDPGDDATLRRLMSLATHGVGIPPKTALVIEAGGQGKVLGEGQIASYRK